MSEARQMRCPLCGGFVVPYGKTKHGGQDDHYDCQTQGCSFCVKIEDLELLGIKVRGEILEHRERLLGEAVELEEVRSQLEERLGQVFERLEGRTLSEFLEEHRVEVADVRQDRDKVYAQLLDTVRACEVLQRAYEAEFGEGVWHDDGWACDCTDQSCDHCVLEAAGIVGERATPTDRPS